MEYNVGSNPELTDAFIHETYVGIYEILFVLFRRRGVAQRMKPNHCSQ